MTAPIPWFQVARATRNSFQCDQLTDGKLLNTIEATAPGNMMKENPPVPGDFVQIPNLANPVISQIQERQNTIFRFLSRTRQKKMIAANIDLMALVFSAEKPEYKRGLLERYLIRSAQWGIAAIVIFSKIDLLSDTTKQLITEEIKFLKPLVSQFFAVSSLSTDKASPWPQEAGDFHQLKNALNQKLVLLVGASGVGKSKLITALSEGKYQLKSQELGKAGKGTHTTTWSEIVRLPEFSLMDSPGIRSFSLDDLESQDLLHYFPDLWEVALTCQFHNCEHEVKSKGCALRNTSSERLRDRFTTYLRIKEEISRIS